MFHSGINLLFRSGVLLCLLIALLTSGVQNVSFAQEEDDSQPQQKKKVLDKALERKVRMLQRKLNSDTLEDREAATKELISLGTKVLDYLPDPDPNFGESFNETIRSIRNEVELIAEKEFSTPRRITLSGEMTVADALAALEVQTGNKIGNSQGFAKGQKITVDWKNILFWEAADDLCAKIKGQILGSEPGKGMIYSGGILPKKENIEVSEGFRFLATDIHTSRNLRIGSPPQGSVSISLKWEPRYRIIKLQIPITSFEAVDSEGKTVEEVKFAKEGSLELGASAEELEKQIPIPFVLVEGQKAKKFDLKGKLNAVVSGRLESFVFGNIEKFTEKRTLKKSGVNVSLVKVAEDGHLLAVTIDVGFSDAKASLESHLGWVYENPAMLVDKDGKTLNYVATESGGQSENDIRIVYLFEKPESLKDWSIKYQSPGILIEKEVPFHIPNIRLPF